MTIFLHFAVVLRALQGQSQGAGSRWRFHAGLVIALVGLVNTPLAGHAAQAATVSAGAATPSDLTQKQLLAISEQVLAISQQLLIDPQNPALLLKKGVLLANAGRTQEALEIFHDLRRQFPQQAAPYVNLASLYAQLGRLEEARQMLVSADKLQSDRYTTQLGLASLNLQLALQAYDNAISLRPGDSVVQGRREELSKLMANAAGGSTGSRPAKPPNPATSSNALSAPDNAPPVENQKQSGQAPDRLTTAAPPVTAQDSASQVPDVGGKDVPQEQAVRRVLDNWATAWSQRSFRDFSAQYSKEYKTGRRVTLTQWLARKRNLIEQAKRIQVDIKIESVRINNGIATVRMQQAYQSDMYSDKRRKDIQLQQQDGEWKIISEKQLRDSAGDRLTLTLDIPTLTGRSASPIASDANSKVDSQEQAVRRVLDNWTSAWNQKSFTNFISLYSGQFRPGRGANLTEWSTKKRKLIELPGHLEKAIRIESVQITDGIATVRMQQNYTKDAHSEWRGQEMQLQEQDGAWKIVREKDIP